MIDTNSLQRDARNQLLRFMEDLSEQHWSAGWVGDLEHLLWDDLTLRQSCGLQHYEAAQLRWLAGLAGGWWVGSHDLGTDPPLRCFVELAPWIDQHAAWVARGGEKARGEKRVP